MCGRFLILSSGDQLVAHFGLAEKYAPRPRYNVAPSQPVLTVGLTREGGRSTAEFRWGLVPGWASDPKPGPINARSETAADKPTFAEALRHRRCLIPASGFYEWEQLPNRRKRPWAFRLKDGGPFAFAGIWEAWRPPAGGKPLFTCAILTTQPNDVVRPVHDRMPVILPPEDYAAWLGQGLTDPAELPPLRPYPSEAMEALPLAPFVNNPKHDGPECLTPA